MKTVQNYEIVDHGIEHSQYFVGCGIIFTEFTDIATGIGNNYGEALDDALEMLAQNAWDCEQLEKLIRENDEWSIESVRVSDEIPDSMDHHYYVSICVK